MERRGVVVAAIAVGLLWGSASYSSGEVAGSVLVRDFRSDKLGSPPVGFTFSRTGGGRPGHWVIVLADAAMGGGNVLAQADADGTDYRYPIAILDKPSLRDIRLTVRCALVSGQVDRACGIVFRYLDANNYYVARANALEENIRLYRVKDGRREQLANWNGNVASGRWHELGADAVGERIGISWDGRKVINVRDTTFPGAGKAGVWIKADSLTWFREIRIQPLGP
jgi:hypothetical protein